MATHGKKLVVVTGLSGSGKSIALNALEDQGFYCVDNLPVSLLQAFANEVVARDDNPYRKIAIGIDARCLPNPHWQPELRPLTGRDQPVAEFLETESKVGQLLADITGFLDQWIPSFELDGRSYLTVAIGCTGGQHRSVYMAERIAEHFRAQGRTILTRHRELS